MNGSAFLKTAFNALLRIFFVPTPHEEIVRGLTTTSVAHKVRMRKTFSGEALLPYNDTAVAALIWQAKYKNDRAAITLLGETVRDYIQRFSGDCVMIPIPLSKERRNSRGYNQVEEVLKSALAEHPERLILNALTRTRDTPAQTNLKRSERLVNLKGAFAIAEESRTHVVGKRIILVDDVITTGTTLHEAREVLLKAGAREVTTLAFAYS